MIKKIKKNIAAYLQPTRGLPNGWYWTSLGEISADKQIGIVRSAVLQNRLGNGVPYLKMNNLTMDGKVATDDIVYVDVSAEEFHRYRLRAGDILFNTRNSFELVGKTGLVPRAAEGFVYNNNLMRIRTIPKAYPSFIAFQMCSPQFRAEMEQVKRATTNVAALYAKDLLPLPIVIAPLDQQKCIVAEIEKQFSRLDEAVANLKRIKVNLKRYKAAVLKAAVDGKLTEDWRKTHPDVESGAKLLTRILTQRRAKWKGKGKYKEPAIGNISDLLGLPEGWVWSTVESLSTKVVDGVHKKPNYVSNGVPFVTVRNLTAGPGINLTNLKYVTREDHDQFIKRANPEEGDVLISKDGTLGVVRVIKTKATFSIFVSVALIKPVLKEMSNYLGWALSAPQVQTQMVPKGSGLQHIHLEDLRADCIPIPPLDEQKEIVAEVERRLSVIEELEGTMDANLTRATRLRQATLKKFFAGKLP